MNNKTKTEPGPGVPADLFAFVAKVQLPEITSGEKDHKNATGNYNNGLKVPYSNHHGFGYYQ
jgi:hypothetical protein